MIIQNGSFRWIDEELVFPRLKQVNDENEGRYYLIEEDESEKVKLFSVTTVLGDDPKKKKAIYEWRKRIGEQEANKISKFATGRGTSVHTLLEKYLRGDELDSEQIMPHVKEMFYSALDTLKNITQIHCLEQKMFSRALGIAGTVDGIIDWNGIPSILDFKTSKRLKTKSHIEDYFLQTCAYAAMWKELTNKKFDQVVIFIMVEEESEPQIFIESVEKYTPFLLKKIKGFYRRRNLELPAIFSR